MELKNPLYKNIGIHVVSNIFTVGNEEKINDFKQISSAKKLV